ncbi:ABC transporter G family member 28 isoform X2 [Physcomitrium patens]|uniref:ABC transporter domain-containing protein n=1 Tax=Physcomitrium patens TaxID=3218 RepID=A0A2K1IS37_PHYPA|nr:hypothetical protein PHYPA_026210 [Physcomitrium patens]
MELLIAYSTQSQLLRGIFVGVVLFSHASVQSAFVHSENSAEFQAAQSSPESMAVSRVSVSPPLTDESGSNQEIKALTANATQLLQDQYGFCISKRERDGLDEIFGFHNSDINLLLDCDALTGGTTTERFCVMSELRLYFENLAAVDTPPPNLNCNATGWDQACEAGWAGRVSQVVELDSEIVPSRLLDPLPCCAGFFCPRGLSCMIPCPLGAYCPLATLNHTTNMCEPYGYQVMQNSNLYAGQCGGADKWADVTSAINIFCPAGHFCPTPIENRICSVGHFCRLGSTDQDKCSHLTTCQSENLQSQNLQGVGGLILAGLLILLVVIYTCSDWLMDLRHRRKAYARDVAARQVLEHISKYKLFKVTAKRQATKLTRKLTRTISRDQRDLSIKEELQENQPTSSTPSSSRRLSANLSPKFQDVLKLMTGYSKKAMTLSTSPRVSLQLPTLVIPTKDTYSQRFAYAYGQIEKERALGHRGTSPDSEQEDQPDDEVIRNRFGIELTFSELSMVLKSSGKKILCNVAGKLSPGRITAIMGPSGAGKTTFLNGLAGKSTNTRTTGQVFVNGKPGPMHSYKRIIGFVPQDDIVHGSLTVEENLWFSANYRLPVNMPIYERVLVVERIIQELGLGGIRDSLVGTVEKRGVSGGQRKRVNVGLELAIEPSLLILDEPTSGLDSTSSRLVLQALRREAMEGVNVILVVHQPSYGLFKMFDDVMFLAKGGYTVYLGPVVEVEAYFSGLGLIVPERINPPDYYMDALEGIPVSSSPQLDLRTMPIMWMRHKGYPIPNDMVDLAGDVESTPTENPSLVHPESSRFSATFFQQACQELYQKILMTWDEIKTALSRVDNLSGRQTPGFFRQLRTILHRVAKQRFREVKLHIQDYVILLIAGGCLGVLSNMDDTNLGSEGYHFTIIALALLIMIASLRTFSADKIQFWRESASGVNRLAFYLAKDMADIFNVVMKPLIYLSMFYFLSNPRSSFLSNYVVTLVLVYCVTGLAYILAILLEPAPAQLCAVFVPVIASLIVSSKKTRFLPTLSYFSYARYALEAYVLANAERYEGVWVITRCGLLASQGYRLENWSKCLLILFGYGVVARIVAILSLLFSHRNRQK